MPRIVSLVFAAAAGVIATAHIAEAQTDPHKLFELRCKSCHGVHGADFARDKMKLEGNTVVTLKDGSPLADLMRNHHGVKLGAAETASLVELFANGLKWAGLFKDKCAGCHGRADEFARKTLAIDGDRLVGKASAADVRAKLADHGGASATQIDTLVEMLRYQLRTAPK